MTPRCVFMIAGEPSGDALAAELVEALRVCCRRSAGGEAQETLAFAGAGGPKMKAAGVELAFDLTAHAVFGITDVLLKYRTFRALFRSLGQLAAERRPEVIVLVDYGGFNRRFAEAIRKQTRRRRADSGGWDPKIVYYVSPQVWASRPKRAYQIARDVDLLLSIFPFEKAWYQARTPGLRVEFVGHPMVDRYAGKIDLIQRGRRLAEGPLGTSGFPPARVLFLPGSRRRELQQHLPLMAGVLDLLRRARSVSAQFVLPNEDMVLLARDVLGSAHSGEVVCRPLAEALGEADLAVACSGTVTLECAYFRVPALVVYKTSWLTYEIARRIIQVDFIAMPNLLAQKAVYPEFIQAQAAPEALAAAALELLDDPRRREAMRLELDSVAALLGPAGASARAAEHIAGLWAKTKS